MNKQPRHPLACGALIAIALSVGTEAFGQQAVGLSFGYESFPHVRLANPAPAVEALEIGASSWSVGAAFPMAFSGGRILALNQLTYARTDFSYSNLPAGGLRIEQVQSVDYTLLLMDSLSAKWTVVALLSPGLASDFGGPVSGDDVTFDGALGLIRRLSAGLQLGLGAAYTSDFGEPLPLPFLYMDWRIAPRLSASGILPTNLALSYRLDPRIDLGASFRVAGNRYHGQPARFDAADPLMRYSEGTISPTARVHLSRWLHVGVEGGFAFYRNFEFYDGGTRTQSLDLRKSGYVRTTLVLGM